MEKAAARRAASAVDDLLLVALGDRAASFSGDIVVLQAHEVQHAQFDEAVEDGKRGSTLEPIQCHVRMTRGLQYP